MKVHALDTEGKEFKRLAALMALAQTRPPDEVIWLPDSSSAYLRRWFIHRDHDGDTGNEYLHEIVLSDDDRAFHDHPWASRSIILAGGYIEITPEGRFERKAGDIIDRTADEQHRLELIDAKPCWSLFQTGPKIREWGFHCPDGWVHWRDYQTQGGC